jgi:hypothetical protein
MQRDPAAAHQRAPAGQFRVTAMAARRASAMRETVTVIETVKVHECEWQKSRRCDKGLKGRVR